MKKLIAALLLVGVLVASLGAAALAEGATTSTHVYDNQKDVLRV